MKKKLTGVFLLLSFMVSANEISVTGNERTKSSYILKLYRRCSQKESVISNNDYEQCILNSKLFSEVKISNTSKGKNIQVKDRWTLIPIPFARSERGESKAGIFLLERNFLGLGQMVVAGGTKGDRSDTIFLMYRDNFFAGTDYSANFLFRRDNETPFRYSGKNVVDAHSINTTEIKGGMGITNSHFSGEINLGASNKKFETYHPYISKPQNNQALTMEIRVSYNNSHYKFYFQEGMLLSIKYASEIYQNSLGKKSNDIEWSASYQKNLLGENVLQLHHYLVASITQGEEDIKYLGGSKGLRGINQKGLWTKSSTGVAMDYQIPLSDHSYGTWTIGPFVDYSIFQCFDQSNKWHNSYGAGIGGYLYLKKIALPGMGLVVGRNPKFEEDYVTFTIGRSI